MMAMIFLSFGVVDCVRAQSQSDSRLDINQEEVTAGDHITLSLEADAPPLCATRVTVAFRTYDNLHGFALGGPIPKGQRKITFDSQIAYDQFPGAYQSTEGSYDPCPGFTLVKSFKVPRRILVLRPFSDPNIYPAQASLVFLPSQKQFLDTKAAQLSSLDSQLTTRLESGSSDGLDLRKFLSGIVRSAAAALDETENQYRSKILKADCPTPAFFADFRRQYEDLLVDLGAPIPGTAAWNTLPEHLVYVQLVQRGATKDSSVPQRRTGTFPPDAIAVKKLIDDNSAAYKYISKTGRITFTARIRSVPNGAQILYKKLIDDAYKDFSGATDIDRVELELATWIFTFRKEGCSDQPTKRIDPYDDTGPDIAVEFTHCRMKR